MDHIHILNQIRDRKTIEKAFQYALFDRIKGDYYFDYFELEYVFQHKNIVIDEILEELRYPEKYTPRPAYAYYPPKTELCYRRMIYIPFKDLVVRYAFVNILVELLDNELSPHCFADRQAEGERAQKALFKDFVTETWPAFCCWQKRCIESYPVLLRTDISAFYDSVSHDYLVASVARELSIEESTDVIQLFRRLLCIPVISYSLLTKTPHQTQENKQGLAIGNGTEGFLANLYLKNVDDYLEKLPGIEYGRYKDDMRIFSQERETALHAILALQENLLTKGLNLNSSKTQIAENQQQLEKLRSKIYQPSSSEIQEEEEEERTKEANILADKIDKSFDDFNKCFEANIEIESNDMAKDFCHFLRRLDLLPLAKRTPQHIMTLEQILTRWQGNGKQASWLVVQSAFFNGIPQETQQSALRLLFDSLKNKGIDSYTKYRFLHYLVKRKGKHPRYLDQLSPTYRQELRELIPYLLEQPAFELNITGLYVIRALGTPYEELIEYVRKYVPKPVGEPIKKALSYIAEPIKIVEESNVLDNEETESLAEPY